MLRWKKKCKKMPRAYLGNDPKKKGGNKRNKTRGREREMTGFEGHGGWRKSKEGWGEKTQDVIRC